MWAAEIGIARQQGAVAPVQRMRKVKGKTLGNRYLLYGSFLIDISSQPFEGKVYGDGRDDEGGGGKVGEMLCEEADTILSNSLCPNIPNFF